MKENLVDKIMQSAYLCAMIYVIKRGFISCLKLVL